MLQPITLKSNILFSIPIVRSTSSISAKVGKFVTVILSLQLINERQITPRTQVQQTHGMGGSFKLF